MDEDTKCLILALVEENHNLTIRQIAEQAGVSASSIYNLLNKEGYKSYKYSNHQEFQPRDLEQRISFAEFMFNKINSNESILHKICFTDEATFTLHGAVNSQNSRYWSRDNLHLMNQTRTQYPQKVNVWVGIFNRQIIGPYFIDGNLTSTTYLQMLREEIVPAISQHNIQDSWFQQDGAPPHSTSEIKQYLDQIFADRWIGRRGPVKWPARSPDLSPNDFFLWGHIKNQVYNHEHMYNIISLKENIRNVCTEITPEQLHNVTRSFYNRLGYCLEVAGGHFEHLI